MLYSSIFSDVKRKIQIRQNTFSVLYTTAGLQYYLPHYEKTDNSRQEVTENWICTGFKQTEQGFSSGPGDSVISRIHRSYIALD
jgi:hypothetical protein